eukprot:6181565-Pleurochrysis_carterae.AAC.1
MQPQSTCYTIHKATYRSYPLDEFTKPRKVPCSMVTKADDVDGLARAGNSAAPKRVSMASAARSRSTTQVVLQARSDRVKQVVSGKRRNGERLERPESRRCSRRRATP